MELEVVFKEKSAITEILPYRSYSCDVPCLYASHSSGWNQQIWYLVKLLEVFCDTKEKL
jgi:hypothetical protein